MRPHYWIKHPMLTGTNICAWCFATDSLSDPLRKEECDRSLAPKFTLHIADENSNEPQVKQKEETPARG